MCFATARSNEYLQTGNRGRLQDGTNLSIDGENGQLVPVLDVLARAVARATSVAAGSPHRD